MIARIMQEEEDRMRAEQLQNDYYTGNRPPTATAPRQRQPEATVEEPVYDRLIPDPREYLEEQWAMDEHNASSMHGAGHYDADYERVLLESMKHNEDHLSHEDEILRQVIEESKRQGRR